MIERYVSPQELRRLLSALLVVVIFICIFALFAFLVVPGMRNANQPLSGPAVSPPQGESGWLDPTDYPPTRGYTLAPVDPKTVMTPTPELLARGQALFTQNCVTCHGPAGRGRRPRRQGAQPAATELQPGGRMEERLPDRRHLEDARGGDQGQRHGGLRVPLQEGPHGPRPLRAILGPFDHGPEDPKKLGGAGRSSSPSSGEVIPNRIPVAQAMSRLEQERTRAPSLPELAGASNLVRWSVIDPARAAQTLAGVPGWQQDEANFARAVVSGLPANGFAPGVSCLDPSQWKNLQEQLSGVREQREDQGEVK